MIVEAVKHALSNYANFSGRTPRNLFWWYVLAMIILMVVLRIIDGAIMGSFAPDPAGNPLEGQPLGALASLALLIPNLAISVRRLHDIGKSGWWLLIGLVPLIGFLVLVYFYVQPSAEE